MYQLYHHSKQNFSFVGHLSTDLRRDGYKLSQFQTKFYTTSKQHLCEEMAELSLSEITRRMETIKQEIENLQRQRLSPNLRSVLYNSNNNIPYI